MLTGQAAVRRRVGGHDRAQARVRGAGAAAALNPAVPPELEQVVLWALNKNPADRPLDADQFITALEAAKAAILGEPGQRTASMATLAAVGGAAGAYAGAAAGATPQDAAAAYRRPSYEDTGPYETEPPHEPPPREASLWPWITLLIVLLIAGGAVAAYLLTRPQKRIVPAVTNQSLNTARTVLQNDGFSVSVLSVTNNKPGGTVIGQDPQGNSKADEGSTVTLTVSSGPGNTTVPSVVGLSQKAAKRALTRAQLKYRVQRESSTTIPKGNATRTEQGAGASVGVGSTVTLFISSGKPTVNVPNVVGQSQSAANTQLTNAGFVVHTTTQTSTDQPAGNVLSPESRRQYQRGLGFDRQPRDRQGADDRQGPRRARRHRPGRD